MFTSIFAILAYYSRATMFGEFQVMRVSKRNHCNVYEILVFIGQVNNAFRIVACEHCQTATVDLYVPYEGACGVNTPDMPYAKLMRVIEAAFALDSDYEAWKLDDIE